MPSDRMPNDFMPNGTPPRVQPVTEGILHTHTLLKSTIEITFHVNTVCIIINSYNAQFTYHVTDWVRIGLRNKGELSEFNRRNKRRKKEKKRREQERRKIIERKFKQKKI